MPGNAWKRIYLSLVIRLDLYNPTRVLMVKKIAADFADEECILVDIRVLCSL